MIEHWDFARLLHLGQREEQQDNVGIFSNTEQSLHLLVLADGMGGHKGGKEASETVISIAKSIWYDWLEHRQINVDPKLLLWYICEAAHQNIIKLGEADGINPRSTCVILYINPTDAYWAHIGDSRLYHFRKDGSNSHTNDHSLVQLLADLERIPQSDLGNHPDQHLLLRCLGSEQLLEPTFGHTPLQGDDMFLMCSDGLWEKVNTEEMMQDVMNHPRAQDGAQALLTRTLARANNKRRLDNISILIAKPTDEQTIIWPKIVDKSKEWIQSVRMIIQQK
ncbi:MAG: protein phosphatase 2C domain-containing protein [Mariprofundales bacterium]